MDLLGHNFFFGFSLVACTLVLVWTLPVCCVATWSLDLEAGGEENGWGTAKRFWFKSPEHVVVEVLYSNLIEPGKVLVVSCCLFVKNLPLTPHSARPFSP
jgi:hypothetical protein